MSIFDGGISLTPNECFESMLKHAGILLNSLQSPDFHLLLYTVT